MFDNLYQEIWETNELEKINDKDILDSFSCKICLNFSLDLKQCFDCLFILCFNCYNSVIKLGRNKNCPQCKITIKKYTSVPKSTLKIMNQIKVYCILKNKGCKKILKLDELNVHWKNNCKFNRINKIYEKINLLNNNIIENLDQKIEINFENSIDLNLDEFNLFTDQKSSFKIKNDKLIITPPKINDYNKNELKYTNNEEIDPNKPIMQKIICNDLNKKESKIYKNGIYNGIIENNLRNGFGIYLFNCGDYYEGFWKNGLKSGKGIYKYNNGSFYQGNWKLNLKSGYGEEKFHNNVYYKGNFEKGKKNGLGLFKFINGNMYEGFWLNNKMNGKGILKLEDGSYYNGNFKNNKKNGYGIEKYNTKNVGIYKGYFKNDLRNGFGRYDWENKDIYFGNWKNDKIDGYGVFIFQSGIYYYEGYWENGLANGFGIEVSEDSLFLGSYKDNKRNGFGKCYFANKERYIGNWKNGLKEGYGEYFYNNGDKYEGNWLKNNKEGEGILIIKNNGKYKGNFKNNKREGYGNFYFLNGNIFKGQWIDDKKEGYGELIYINNEILKGIWINNEFEISDKINN